MLRIEPVPERRRPPWWRTVLLGLLACFGTLTGVVYSPVGWRTGADGTIGVDILLALVGLLVGFLGPVALFWRHRRPLLLSVVAAVASVLAPLGNTLAFITLGALISRRRGPLVWVAAGLTAVTSTWVVVADAMAQPVGASFLKTLLAPVGADTSADAEVGVPTIVVMSVLGWGASVGLGLVVRGRREAAAAKVAAQADRRTTTALGDEVARRTEREQIAREVHDVLGHRLSLLSLHAGAMEANADGDERLQSSAALVRDNASGAMEDLRSLLGVLRQPAGEQPELPLTMLPQVVEESFGAGQLLSSSVFIQDAEQADPTLSRAVYRIVQEVLTNARKHAPGQHVILKVTGGPTVGITVDVRNPTLPATSGAASPGSHRGLVGIAERAELLGGSLRHGLDDGGKVFRVEVRLPWIAVDRAGT